MSKPTIICLCGSTRFSEAFHEANLRETLRGKIVLSIGCDFKSDADLLLAGELTPEDKARLDELHLRKIDLCDEVLVLNVDDYVGESTKREIAYAVSHRKIIRWLVYPTKHMDTEIRAAIDHGIAMAQRLPLTILGIIAEATVHPHRGGYIASWDITKRLEALRYEDVSIGSRIPGTVYDTALQQLIAEGLIEEVPDLGQRYRLKNESMREDHE